MTAAVVAPDLVATVLDAGSFRSWDAAPAHPDADAGYRRQLAAATRHSGADEAVRTGQGTLGGRPIAVVTSVFGFLGGSVGAATADRIVAAVEQATAYRLPMLAATASGGTRMQEGTPAFLRMADITAAVLAHRAAGLLSVVHLGHPTTGGVLASWGSLGQITLAAPGALIGFLGPRVHAALHGGEPFPTGVQTAENLHAHGLVDGVVGVEELRPRLGRLLALLDEAPALAAPGRAVERAVERAAEEAADDRTSAWEHVLATRRPDRPRLLELLQATGGAAPVAHTAGVHLGIARLGPGAAVIVGQDGGPVGPAGVRLARRGVALAGELRLPLVTVVDTTGAELSAAAEEAGLAAEIARCLADVVAAPGPTVSVLLGQGTGGAALALLPADRVIAAGHAWLTPLPPEGAATLLHGTAPDAADTQHIRAVDLWRAGAVDRIVAERPDAADEPAPFLRRLLDAVDAEVRRIAPVPTTERLAARRLRLRARPPR